MTKTIIYRFFPLRGAIVWSSTHSCPSTSVPIFTKIFSTFTIPSTTIFIGARFINMFSQQVNAPVLFICNTCISLWRGVSGLRTGISRSTTRRKLLLSWNKTRLRGGGGRRRRSKRQCWLSRLNTDTARAFIFILFNANAITRPGRFTNRSYRIGGAAATTNRSVLFISIPEAQSTNKTRRMQMQRRYMKLRELKMKLSSKTAWTRRHWEIQWRNYESAMEEIKRKNTAKP